MGCRSGLYTVTVQARDSLGALGDPASFTFVLVPPPPTVVSAPASPLNSRTPTWTVTDFVSGVTYSCSVTGPSTAGVDCSGSTVRLDLGGAVDGVYTVSILAVDGPGTPATPHNHCVVTYRLDTTAPVAPALGVTPSPSQGRSATFTISGVEPLGTVSCQLIVPTGATVTVPAACGSGATIDLTGQPDGRYTLRVTVTDVAGNTNAPTFVTYVLDTTAPTAPIATIASPGNDVTPTPTVIVEPGATLTCAIQRYFLPVATVACGTDGTVDLSACGDGEYEISVWATDAAGNVSAPVRRTPIFSTPWPRPPRRSPRRPALRRSSTRCGAGTPRPTPPGPAR